MPHPPRQSEAGDGDREQLSDVWITPFAATPAFSHRPTGARIEVDGEPLPHEIVNGSWSIPVTAALCSVHCLNRAGGCEDG
ncbi:hypothetical protein [Sorangium sp. So ce887]|uniref:hypothetical protein n=1 Tax=Sorangium sp. So ce887 TaxID=3133324 RepID=UPI003F62E8FE